MTQESIAEKPKVPMTTGKYVIIIAAVINIVALAWVAYKSFFTEEVSGKTNMAIMAVCLMNTIILLRCSCKNGKC